MSSLAWMLFAGAAAGSPTPVLPPRTTAQTLDNGLRVIVLPLETPGLAAVQIWMDVGSRNETVPGTTGYAHFFEHLMFHGSRQVPRAERERRLLELAVVDNAWTSEDHTVYVSLGPSASVSSLLELEADRFTGLFLEPDAVKREAGAVQGELRKAKANPGGALWDALSAAAFTVHPYGHPVIGTDADVAGMQDGFGAVSDFFATHYAPANATLVVAGDVDPDAVVAQAEATLGQWQGASASPRPALPAEPLQEAARRTEVAWERGSVSPRLALAWRVPAFVPGDPGAEARVLLSQLLGSRVSPLHRRLVEEERLATELWVPEPTSRSPGLFVVYAELRPEADVARVEAIIREEVATLQGERGGAGGAVAPEVEQRVQDARNRARRSALLALDSPAAWASAVGRMASYRGRPRDLGVHIHTLSTLDAETVQQAAVETFVEERLTVGLLGPPELLAAQPAGQGSDLPEVTP